MLSELYHIEGKPYILGYRSDINCIGCIADLKGTPQFIEQIKPIFVNAPKYESTLRMIRQHILDGDVSIDLYLTLINVALGDKP